MENAFSPEPKAWDDLEALVEDLTIEDPTFPSLVAAVETTRSLAKRLYARRRAAGLSRHDVAIRMGIPQSVVAELERGWVTPRLVTVLHYAAVIGFTLELVDEKSPSSPISVDLIGQRSELLRSRSFAHPPGGSRF